MNICRNFGRALLLLMTALAARAVEDELDFTLRIWNMDDGVPQGEIKSMAQSADGLLWFASDSAVARFDGVRFEGLEAGSSGSLTGPFRLVSTESGVVWLSTGSGDGWRWNGKEFEQWCPGGTFSNRLISVFEEREDGFLLVTRKGEIVRAQNRRILAATPPARNNELRRQDVCRDSEGMIWMLGDGQELLRTDTRTMKTLRLTVPEGEARALARDDSGLVWVGTTRGLWRWKNDHFELLPPPDNLTPFPVDDVRPAPGGRLWVLSDSRWWLCQEGRWTPFNGSWDARNAGRCLVDHEGRLWFAPLGNLTCVNTNGERMNLGDFGKRAGYAALFCDREGNIWSGVYRLGVACFTERKFETVLAKPDARTVVEEEAKGVVWFLAERGTPMRWRAGDIERIPIPQKNVNAETRPIPILGGGYDRGVYAAVQDCGVLGFDDKGFTLLAGPFEQVNLRTLYKDRLGRFWLGSATRLYCWKEGQWQKVCGERGCPQAGVCAVVEDASGCLWFGTVGGGLARMIGDQFEVFTTKDGLPHNHISALVFGTDGSLWIGTPGGLARLRNGRFTSYDEKMGLPDKRVVQVIEDGMGFLWCGTRNGLCRISLSSLDAVDAGKAQILECQCYGYRDGLSSSAFLDNCSPACLKAHDGSLWFLTTSGVIRFFPDRIGISGARPRVLIESVSVDDRVPAGREPDRKGHSDVPLSALALNWPEKVVIPPGAQTVGIRYTAPFMKSGDQTRFEYRLEGLEKGWIRATGQRKINYGTLPSGNYRFVVKACSPEGLWSEAVAGVDLVVLPYFWQTRWFRAAVVFSIALTAVGATVLVLRGRQRRALAQLELRHARDTERARIARDLHDDLGAALAEINFLASAGAGTPPTLATAGQRFTAIFGKARDVIASLDGIVWAVDPQKDNLLSLGAYLRGYVEDFLSSARLACRIETPSELPDLPLTPEMRHALLLAVKEVLHNIVRHAQATEVHFRIAAESGRVEISLSDNGRGFDEATVVSGNGLRNLRNRLSAIGGLCEILSQPGKGTTVRLLLPLNPITDQP